MEQDKLTRDQAQELEKTEASDEISKLSHMFGRMALEVIVREEKLRLGAAAPHRDRRARKSARLRDN